MEKTKLANEIVLKGIWACYQDKGILASNVNYADFWARDTFWASLGMLNVLSDTGKDTPSLIEKTDLQQIKNSLEMFIDYQRPDGKIPRKICLDYNGLRYLGIKLKRKVPRPIYTSSIQPFFSFDDNLLFVMAFCQYVQVTKNDEFAKKYFSNLTAALSFYQQKNLVHNSLLYEFGFGNWMDTIFKTGAVLYTNCLWYQAIKDYETLSTKVKVLGVEAISALANDLPTDKQASAGKHQSPLQAGLPTSTEIKRRLLEKFWLEKEKYFTDTIHKNGLQQKYFDLAGNLLTILFDIADLDQAKTIFKKIESIHELILHPCNHPRYPWWKISPVCYLFNIQDYQNQISWSWIEALLAIAQLKCNQPEKAHQTLENISNLIIKHTNLAETYYLDGRKFDHLFWKSAIPFTWGGGLFLWASTKLKNSNFLI